MSYAKVLEQFGQVYNQSKGTFEHSVDKRCNNHSCSSRGRICQDNTRCTAYGFTFPTAIILVSSLQLTIDSCFTRFCPPTSLGPEHNVASLTAWLSELARKVVRSLAQLSSGEQLEKLSSVLAWFSQLVSNQGLKA